MLVFYVKSAGPAALERKIGPAAYARCTAYRVVASVFELIAVGGYVVYVFHPLPVSLPLTFPWAWWVSGAIAGAIAVPAGGLMVWGLIDAGGESLAPKKERKLYGGIYDKIRHPQAAGELPLWWAVAFALHSPFLAMFSFIWVPVFVAMCLAEEKDLLIRYGKAYEEYRSRTGAFIPRLR